MALLNATFRKNNIIITIQWINYTPGWGCGHVAQCKRSAALGTLVLNYAPQKGVRAIVYIAIISSNAVIEFPDLDGVEYDGNSWPAPLSRRLQKSGLSLFCAFANLRRLK